MVFFVMIYAQIASETLLKEKYLVKDESAFNIQTVNLFKAIYGSTELMVISIASRAEWQRLPTQLCELKWAGHL